MFYKAIVKPGGKPAVFVPPPEEHMLHLSQAALPHDVPTGTRASLMVQPGGGEEPVVLCTLCAGGLDTVPLDQFFSHYTEFTVKGGAPIHVTGYYAPQHEEDEDGPDMEEDGDEEEDDDYVHAMHPMLMGESDEEEDGSEEDEDEDDEDGSEEEEDEGEDLGGWGAPPRRKPEVTIEEITDDDKGQHAAKGSANGVAVARTGAKQQQKQGKKQQQESESDDEGEDSEDNEGESDNDSEEAAAPARPGDKRKSQAPAMPASKKQQQQQKGMQKQQQQQQQQQQQAEKTPTAKTPKEQQQQQQQKPKQQQTPQQTAAKTPQQPTAAAPKTPALQAAAASQQQQQQTPGSAKRAKPRIYENGFEIHDVKMGQPDGRVARAGKKVSMRYVGRLKKNGKVFDSNTKGRPFSFRLGVGEVIKGWDRGVEGMRVGDKRKLVIPPQMAYGSQALPGIPPNSTLEFDVELVDVKG